MLSYINRITYMYICIYTCNYIYIYILSYLSIYIYIYTWYSIYIYISIYIVLYYIYILCIYAYTCIYYAHRSAHKALFVYFISSSSKHMHLASRWMTLCNPRPISVRDSFWTETHGRGAKPLFSSMFQTLLKSPKLH